MYMRLDSHHTVAVSSCSRPILVQLFLRIAGVSYGRFMACTVVS